MRNPATRESRTSLPAGAVPRGLCRIQAAEYIGVSPTKFDEMIKDKRMPKPKRIDARVVWDRLMLDLAFAALPDGSDRDDPWGTAAV